MEGSGLGADSTPSGSVQAKPEPPYFKTPDGGRKPCRSFTREQGVLQYRLDCFAGLPPDLLSARLTLSVL